MAASVHIDSGIRAVAPYGVRSQSPAALAEIVFPSMPKSKKSPVRRAGRSTSTTPPPPSPPNGKTVLLAVSGSSPAILTETIWALARETPPVIPDLVVAVTTSSGARALETQLLTPLTAWRNRSVWQALRQDLLGASYARDNRLTLEAPVLVTRANPNLGTACPVDDIRSPEDNAAAAETILAAVRRFSTDPEIRLLGLLSGGRKTMGALLHAAFSLAGRPGDRLLHVLVTEPFDHPRLTPTFFFPDQPDATEHHLPGPDAKIVPHKAAHIELADVPLVALGELIFNRTGQAPATFASFARVAQATLTEAGLSTAAIKVTFSTTTRKATVNQHTVTLPEGRSATFFRQLVIDAARDEELADRRRLEERWRDGGIKYRKSDGSQSGFTDDDLSNAQNAVRTDLLETANVPEVLVDRLFPRRSLIGLNRDGISVQLVD